MTGALPKAVEAYFTGANAHDADVMVQAFAADAVVRDEGKTHRGHDEIAAWARGTIEKYRMTLTPLDVSGANGSLVVRAKVAGTFPGSPIELTFNFELADGVIRSLKIG